MSTREAFANDDDGSRQETAVRDRLIGVASVGFYALLAILLFRPLNPLATDYLSRGGIGDPAQMVWFLAYTPHALSHGLNPFWTNLIGYPGGVNLANNTSVPLLGLLGWPITATLGPIATFNLLVRVGIFLSATSLFFVAHRWITSRVACFLAGLCYGFSPYIIGQAIFNTHINLLFIPIFPILVLLLDEVFVRQRWSWQKTAVLLGCASAAEMLIAPELLSDFGLVAFTVVCYLMIRHLNRVLARLGYALRALGGSAVIFVVICGFQIFEMLFGRGHLRGAVYAIDHLQSFHNSLVETFIPTSQQLLGYAHLGASLQPPTRDLNELGGYLSIPLVLVLILIIVVLRRRPVVLPVAFGTLVAYVLAAGGSVYIARHVLMLPEHLLTLLPLLKNTVPDRFSLETTLGASLLLGVGIDAAISSAHRHSGTTRYISYGLISIATTLVLLALAPRLPLREQHLIWPATTASDIATHVARGAVVLTYPYPMPPLNEAMAWQAEAGFSYTMLGGYATVPGPDGVGQEWPVLLAPSAAQSYFGELDLGHHSRYPHVATPKNTDALCEYADRYHVSDIVIFHTDRLTLAIHYFGALSHTVSVGNPTISIYHLVRTRSGTIAHCH